MQLFKEINLAMGYLTTCAIAGLILKSDIGQFPRWTFSEAADCWCSLPDHKKVVLSNIWSNHKFFLSYNLIPSSLLLIFGQNPVMMVELGVKVWSTWWGVHVSCSWTTLSEAPWILAVSSWTMSVYLSSCSDSIQIHLMPFFCQAVYKTSESCI